MREIKFRAKSPYTEEWIYGYLFKIWDECYILWGTTNNIPNMIKVDPKTIGQYTGLKDKNEKEIYEGDIAKYTLQNHETDEIYYENFTIIWSKETASYVMKNNTKGTLCIDYIYKRRNNWQYNRQSRIIKLRDNVAGRREDNMWLEWLEQVCLESEGK